LIDMPDSFRAARNREIRQILAENTALLDDLLETQRDFSRQRGSTGANPSDLVSRLEDLKHTVDSGFAELDDRIEHLTGLVRQLVEKKLSAQVSSPASRSINSPSCQVPSGPRS
jgi:hypothetical protein